MQGNKNQKETGFIFNLRSRADSDVIAINNRLIFSFVSDIGLSQSAMGLSPTENKRHLRWTSLLPTRRDVRGSRIGINIALYKNCFLLSIDGGR